MAPKRRQPKESIKVQDNLPKKLNSDQKSNLIKELARFKKRTNSSKAENFVQMKRMTDVNISDPNADMKLYKAM